jgi:hypothetical protein
VNTEEPAAAELPCTHAACNRSKKKKKLLDLIYTVKGGKERKKEEGCEQKKGVMKLI